MGWRIVFYGRIGRTPASTKIFRSSMLTTNFVWLKGFSATFPLTIKSGQLNKRFGGLMPKKMKASGQITFKMMAICFWRRISVFIVRMKKLASAAGWLILQSYCCGRMKPCCLTRFYCNTIRTASKPCWLMNFKTPMQFSMLGCASLPDRLISSWWLATMINRSMVGVEQRSRIFNVFRMTSPAQ